jgi:SAM-dependent methyltransferase
LPQAGVPPSELGVGTPQKGVCVSEQHEQAARWDRWAEQDVRVFGTHDPRPATTFLAKLAGGERALELGPGAGQVAMALAEHGIPVTALEISPQMAKHIEQRKGELPVTVQVGDMAEFDVDGQFNLIYTTTSTFYSLLTQQRQIDCFSSVARALTGDGRFVIDAFVPLKVPAVLGSQVVSLRDLTPDLVDLSATKHNPVTQRILFQEVRLESAGMRILPIEIRYAWPSELDLMARLVGLCLVGRYSGWDEQPYGSSSTRHVSVYGKR